MNEVLQMIGLSLVVVLSFICIGLESKDQE